MKKFVRKSLTYFMVFSVILWNVGAPTFAAESQGLNVQKTTNDKKITICHVVPSTPGHAGHTETIEISESAWPTHEAHGDTLGACEEDPYPVPVVDASFNVDNTSVLITWEEITDERLDGYKVVMSETNPNPAYPDDGYIHYETDSTVTSYDYPYEYVCDQDYYFSVTALYDGHNDPGEIVAGNAVTLNFACETASYCDNAEYVFETDLGVVGDGCYNGNDWSTVDTEIISMSLAGNYEVYAEVERSEANVQLAETFTLGVGGTTGPELEDNEETETLIEQYAGDFDFVSGNNEVTMTTTALCPPDETPNSVRVVKLCLNPNSEPNAYCGDGEVNQKSEQCDDGNNENGDGCDAQCQLEDQEDPHLTVKAHKVVCDSEEYLPNWGDGSGPSQITATTAVEFVAQNSQHCHLEQNWSFQWGIGVPVMPGDHIGPATSGDWQGFDSVSDGTIPAKVDIYDNSGTIKVRENLKEGYVPFSYTPGSGQTPPGDDVSAEIYCHNDILNYDNYDYINNPQFDTTYYCVAFNAEISEEEPDPTPWCSALRGIVSHAINTQTYSDVADLNDDGKVNLTDVGMMAQMYGNADDDVCYDQFEDPEDEFHFSCQDYESIGWCDAIVQGVGDFKTAGVYSEFYDLNDDNVIDLSDWAMAAQLLNEDDQAVCYANFVPPLPEMNCGGPEYSAYCGDGEVNQDWEQCDPGKVNPLSTTNGGGGQIVGCSEQCQFVTPPEQCTDLTLAKIHVEDVQNWNDGDMTSNLYLGSDSYVIPHDVWFALYWNGSYYLDSDLSNYEDVPGMSVQRLEDSLRVVMHGSGDNGEKEHVDGHIEFWNASVTGQESDNATTYPRSNQLENGFNNSGVGQYNAGDDEVWVEGGMSKYWLTTTTADDGYYTHWQIIEDCDGPSLCGVKFNDVDRNGIQSDSESNLADWTINLYEKYSCEPGDEWADHVVSYTPGPDVPAERSNPNQALGVAENNDTINFVSLGVNGELVLEFDNFIENGSGDDIQVFETTYNNSSCASYPEYIHVYASQDGNNWVSLGSGCQEGDPTFDLGVLPWAKYVKLVDENSTTPDGFDVDGVKALHCLNAGEQAIDSTTTTENGYCFSDIEPGDYLVCEEMQEGWENATPVCQQVSLEEEDEVTVDFGNYETQDQSIPYAPWCSALLGIVRGAIQNQTYNDVADLNDDGKVNLSDVALVAQLYGQGDDPACYTNFEDPEDEYHWTCENLEQVDWCGGLYQGITDSYGSQDGDDDYFFVFDLHDDHGDGTYGDGVINLSDLGVMASYLAEPVDQYQCYNHYPFFDCTPNTPPVITLIGDDPVYVTQGNTYTDAGATAADNEDGDITDQIVTNNSVDTDTPGIYIITYNVTDSDGAAADEVTRTVIVQSGGGGEDPICGNGIVEQGESCDGSAPDGYTCNDQCQLVEDVCTTCGGGGGGGNFLPIISDVEEAPQCEMTNITWKTSDSSPTWIIYGTDQNNLDQEYKSDDETRNHSFSLAGLEVDTTYYFTIKAENEDGTSETTGHSFTTPPAEVCGEVLGEKIVEEPAICDFVRPSGSKGHDADIEGVVKYPDGTLIRYECDHTMGVYVIMEQMKKHIPTWQDLHDHYFGQRIYNVSWEVFSGYRNYEVETGGEVAGVKAYADGTLLRGSDKKVYIIEHGKKRHITTLAELAKYAGQEIVDVSDEVLNQY